MSSSGHVQRKIAAASKRFSEPLLPELAAKRLRIWRERKAAQAAAKADPRLARQLKWSTKTILHEYADDPVGFFRDVLRTELWEKQADIARSLARNRRVGARSGHKVGKTRFAAGAAIWWTVTRAHGRAIMTAPTERQVEKAIWYEIRRYYAECPLLQRLMPEPALAPSTGSRWDDGRELFGFTAANADSVSGPSGSAVLIIVDEGSGVSRGVWEALQGIRAGGGKVLALGNPTQTSGWFFDAFHERRAGWELFHISSKDTPNVIEGRVVIPGLADRDFIHEIAEDYGEDSPVYAVRVSGDFPQNVANAVIGLGLVEAARARWDGADEPVHCVDLGVDVARYGDDNSAVSARRNDRLFTPEWFQRERGIAGVVNGYDGNKVANLVVQCMREVRNPGERCRIKIDSTGGYGGAVADALRKMRETGDIDEGIDIIEVNFSCASSDPAKWPLVRDELWFSGRKFFQTGGMLYPRDSRCDSELMAPTYSPGPKGSNKVEPKADTKKRLGRSPDRAESALLAIFDAHNPIEDFSEDDPPPAEESRWEGYSGFGYG